MSRNEEKKSKKNLATRAGEPIASWARRLACRSEVRVGTLLCAAALGLNAVASGVRERGRTAPQSINPSDADYFFERAVHLPAPGNTALPYEVRHPLHNGQSVPLKKRWLEVPTGQQVVLMRKADGRWEPDVPAGTKLWKEFYYNNGKEVGLVERRLTLKIDSSQATTVGHDDDWIFISAFQPPVGTSVPSPSGWVAVGPLSRGDVPTRFFSPNQPLPIQRAGGPVEVFARQEDAHPSYVFPGTTACATCHGGATAGFREADGKPTLAFGIHPDNITAASLERLVAAGAVRVEYEVPTPSERKDTFSDKDAVHTNFLGVLRNNCVSCHNSDSLAAARSTAFVLDPSVQYSRSDLLTRLTASKAIRHADALPLVTPGSPEKSELILRMTGHGGRRRMPPVEGGVPEVDSSLVELASRWIEGAEPQD